MAPSDALTAVSTTTGILKPVAGRKATANASASAMNSAQAMTTVDSESLNSPSFHFKELGIGIIDLTLIGVSLFLICEKGLANSFDKVATLNVKRQSRHSNLRAGYEIHLMEFKRGNLLYKLNLSNK
jgi:hypothetical protein